MKVEITAWRPVGYWVWNVKDPDEVCGICQSNYDGTCATCRVPGSGCPISVGTCSHAFHLHCIQKWLRSNEFCPMCKRPWATEGDDDEMSQVEQ